jgi:hypothetical protein
MARRTARVFFRAEMLRGIDPLVRADAAELLAPPPPISRANSAIMSSEEGPPGPRAARKDPPAPSERSRSIEGSEEVELKEKGFVEKLI